MSRSTSLMLTEHPGRRETSPHQRIWTPAEIRDLVSFFVIAFLCLVPFLLVVAIAAGLVSALVVAAAAVVGSLITWQLAVRVDKRRHQIIHQAPGGTLRLVEFRGVSAQESRVRSTNFLAK